jgi:hypothetical protein
MTNEDLLESRHAVGVAALRLGACSVRELMACCSLPRATVEACLYSLALDGKVKPKALYIRRGKKGFSFVYWQHTAHEGNYHAIRSQLKIMNPKTFAAASVTKSSPRVLIVDSVRRIIREEYPIEYSVDMMRETLGVTYPMVQKAFKLLEQQGVVKVRKEIYGRGRPRLMYSAVNGEVPKEAYSFDDDPEAVDLE